MFAYIAADALSDFFPGPGPTPPSHSYLSVAGLISELLALAIRRTFYILSFRLPTGLFEWTDT